MTSTRPVVTYVQLVGAAALAQMRLASDRKPQLRRICLVIALVGAKTIQTLSFFGRFGIFTWQTIRWMAPSLLLLRTWRRTMPLFYEVGNRTVPVIAVTGTFVGLVLAVQSYDQLKSAGFEERMGVLVSLSLVQELGPVLAGVMVAGRVGGALTAELGTMRVTDQVSAMTVMGVDPIRYLVVPRFLACLLLTPLLTFFCDFCGSLSGWFIAVQLKNVPSGPYWFYIQESIEKWDLMVGLVKSLFFGGAIGLISCYKGFHCRAGAAGVGLACTQSFVMSFITILVADFFIGYFLSGLYRGLFGFKSLV